MRNSILAVTAAMAFAAGAAPSLTDDAGSSNILAQCTSILANPTGYRAGMVAYCHSMKKEQVPSAVRTAPPMIRGDGPKISLPG